MYGHYGHKFHVNYHLEFPRHTTMKEDTHTHVSYNGYTWTLIMVTPKSKVGPKCRTYSKIKSYKSIKTRSSSYNVDNNNTNITI